MTLADRRLHGDTPRPGVNVEDQESMPTFTDYLKADRGAPPEFFFERSTRDLGNDSVPVEVFTSPVWHQRETEKLWTRMWQVACRENDVPNVGDQLAYDVVGQSVLVVRTAPDEIRAYHNSCRHRGTRLVESCASASQIQCTFHSWTWNLDGTLKHIPCRWDFPTVCDEEVPLVEVKVARWNGMVWVNLDPGAGPLEDFIPGEVRRQLERWPENRGWKAAHIGKILPCNWKAALAAFIEVYHAFKVHPELMEYAADANAQYDFYGPHARMLSAIGAPSPHLGQASDDQAIVDAMLGDAFANLFGDSGAAPEIPQLGPGDTARGLLSDFMRQSLGAQTGVDFSGISDTEVLDAIEYFVFPNTVIWGGYAFPMHYRVRPNGHDHRSCLWEVMIIAPMPEGVPLPPDVPMRMTATEEPWSASAELALLGPILDQDMVNLTKLQRGLESDACQAVRLSNYQERNIRNFHQHLAARLEG
ncbi:MAG: aromatic ring-hydroxylating oxygenase subunit alpha [Acidimicrobiia bacterium]